MNTFPKPLTAEEEKFYLQKYKEGDLEAKNILIERNMRLVAHVAKKYQHLDDDPDDLISIGTIGLIKAVGTFNPDKGSRLATYAARCIDNELLMMLRSKKKSAKDVSLYEPVGTGKEGNEMLRIDNLEYPDLSISEKVNLKQDIEHLYHNLSRDLKPREKKVLEMRYGLYNKKEYTQREIAQMLGISRSYVSRIEKSAIEKLKNRFQQ